jgi:hypothetical protein
MENESDYLQSDDVLRVIDVETSEEKIFHIIERSNDLHTEQEVAKMLAEEHGQENMIIYKHGQHELFTYPIIGDGEDAHFRR